MQSAKLYEAHLMTSNLEKAIQFYKELGFTLATVIEERRVAFFYLGDVEVKENMIGIWETSGEIQRRHIAFSISLEELRNAIEWLKTKGIEAREAFGLLPSEPLVHAWMPAASVYFNDPDGNSLEYISLLEGSSQKDLNVIHLSRWEKLNQN